QAKRLEQIQLQLSGLGALMDFSAVSRVLAKLTLTPAQATKIDAIIAEAADQTRALGQPPVPFFVLGQLGGTRTETEQQKKARIDYVNKVREIDQKALAKVTATFDAGQKVVWKELMGEPIDEAKVLGSDSPIQSYTRFGGFRGASSTISSAWAREVAGWQVTGRYAAALAAIDEAIRLAPNNASYLIQKASLLATCPADLVRDGKTAVELARKAIAQTKEPTYTQYDVLASAYAEA